MIGQLVQYWRSLFNNRDVPYPKIAPNMVAGNVKPVLRPVANIVRQDVTLESVDLQQHKA